MDGNCLFRAFSYIITGSEDQHFELRSFIIAHMLSLPPGSLTGYGSDGHLNYLQQYNGGYDSVEDYLETTNMATGGTWGTDFEMTLLAHILGTVVYSYNARGQFWIASFAHGIDRSLPQCTNVRSMYIHLRSNHFEVVTSVRNRVA